MNLRDKVTVKSPQDGKDVEGRIVGLNLCKNTDGTEGVDVNVEYPILTTTSFKEEEVQTGAVPTDPNAGNTPTT